VTGAVSCVAGPANRSLAVVTGVTTKAALVDLAIWGSIEGQTHVL